MNRIKKLKKLLEVYKLDGYLVPKNDEFFGEYIPKDKDNLKFISNFSGSYGFALILKNKNYLFVDGRYTLQAKIQSGKNFTIVTIPNKLPYHLLKERKYTINGAKKKIQNNAQKIENNYEAIERLKKLRIELVEIRNNLKS